MGSEKKKSTLNFRHSGALVTRLSVFCEIEPRRHWRMSGEGAQEAEHPVASLRVCGSRRTEESRLMVPGHNLIKSPLTQGDGRL